MGVSRWRSKLADWSFSAPSNRKSLLAWNLLGVVRPELEDEGSGCTDFWKHRSTYRFVGVGNRCQVHGRGMFVGFPIAIASSATKGLSPLQGDVSRIIKNGFRVTFLVPISRWKSLAWRTVRESQARHVLTGVFPVVMGFSPFFGRLDCAFDVSHEKALLLFIILVVPPRNPYNRL